MIYGEKGPGEGVRAESGIKAFTPEVESQESRTEYVETPRLRAVDRKPEGEIFAGGTGAEKYTLPPIEPWYLNGDDAGMKLMMIHRTALILVGLSIMAILTLQIPIVAPFLAVALAKVGLLNFGAMAMTTLVGGFLGGTFTAVIHGLLGEGIYKFRSWRHYRKNK